MEDVIKQSSNDSSITTTLESILNTGGIGSRFFGYVFDMVDGVYDIVNILRHTDNNFPFRASDSFRQYV